MECVYQNTNRPPSDQHQNEHLGRDLINSRNQPIDLVHRRLQDHANRDPRLLDLNRHKHPGIALRDSLHR